MISCKNGCGYQNAHRGGMNLHEKIHCKAGGGSQQPVDQSNDVDVCKHDFVPLDDRRSNHQNAIAHGYTVLCKKCLGVE